MRPNIYLALFLIGPLFLTSCVFSVHGKVGSGGRIVREDPGRLGPYSGSVLAGDFCFASGKIGSDRSGTFEREVETCIDAVEAELARSDLDLGDVVEATVYLTDLGQYGKFNAIYSNRFPAPYPARACVQVAALPGNARVEIMVRARR